MIDLHCHLLPGVDDGALDWSEALSMAEGLVGLGFHHVCCTPHLPWSTFTRSEQELDELRTELQGKLDAMGLDLRLHVGAEHHSSVVAELMAAGNLIAYPSGDYFLMEFPLGGLPANWEEIFFRLEVKGLHPVLAHVERYPEVQQDLGLIERFKSRGCRILTNLSSLVGAWDRATRHAARQLLRAGLIDAANTDMHRASEIESLADGLKELEKLVGAEALRRMTSQVPAEIAGIPAEDRP